MFMEMHKAQLVVYQKKLNDTKTVARKQQPTFIDIPSRPSLNNTNKSTLYKCHHTNHRVAPPHGYQPE